jgi:opacity protein-like surface antigen
MKRKIMLIVTLIMVGVFGGANLFSMGFVVEAGGSYTSPLTSENVDYESAFGFMAGVGTWDLLPMGAITIDLGARFIQKNWDPDWTLNYIELYPKFKWPVSEEIFPYLGIGVGLLLSSEISGVDAIDLFDMNTIDLTIGVGAEYLINNMIIVGAAYNYSLIPAFEISNQWFDYNIRSSNLTIYAGIKF